MRDVNVTTICPVVAVHGQKDAIATGSSRNIFVWTPHEEEEAEEGEEAAEPKPAWKPLTLDLDDKKKGGKGGKKGKDDDDDGDDFPRKKAKKA